MGLYTILYYPSNNEPLPISHLTIGYLAALPNITNVTIGTLTTHLLAPATLYAIIAPMFMHHNFKICVDKGGCLVTSVLTLVHIREAIFNFQTREAMNEYGRSSLLRMNREKIQPLHHLTYVTSTRFMFVSTHDKHVLESAQSVHYRTSVAKQHV
jgi:hypothetical protein